MSEPAAAPSRPRRRSTDRRKWYEAPISKAIGLLAGGALTFGAGWFQNDPHAKTRESVRQIETDIVLRELRERVEAIKCSTSTEGKHHG